MGLYKVAPGPVCPCKAALRLSLQAALRLSLQDRFWAAPSAANGPYAAPMMPLGRP